MTYVIEDDRSGTIGITVGQEHIGDVPVDVEAFVVALNEELGARGLDVVAEAERDTAAEPWMDHDALESPEFDAAWAAAITRILADDEGSKS